jgi:transcriptional regulator with XRE-family HTH domain
MDEITIGARLRTLRRCRGLTQVELADRAGLSASYISMVEHGDRLLDRCSHIAALAGALRVSETDLVGGPHLSSDRLQSDPHLATLRAKEAATLLGDPVAMGEADYAWLSTLPRAGSQDRNLLANAQAAEQLEPSASEPLGRQVLGMLTLTAALSAAVAQQETASGH